MNTYEIQYILEKMDKCTGGNYLGTFASDRIRGPKKHLDKQYLIVNTHGHRKRGEHWLAIYLERREDGQFIGEYFDSFGLPPLVYNIKKYLEENCIVWDYSKEQIQPLTSNKCGLYTILYLALRCRGMKMKEIVKYLKTIGDKNLEYVLKRLYK